MKSTSIELSSISFFGRPYSELLKCFGLDEAFLIGKSVLECPSGPSSFAAEANAAGIRATGVDPLFYRNAAAIRDLAEADFRCMFAKVKASREQFVSRTYRSIDEAEATRWAALQRFLSDYATGRVAGRYVEGQLPYLDFCDRSFDIVLCGHLLFVYSDQLDYAFHEKSIRELCRVAKKEVRIHPLVTRTNEPYEGLESLRELALAEGFESCVESVNHEFFRDTDKTLVLRRVHEGGGLTC